jgi:hypothetical protein
MRPTESNEDFADVTASRGESSKMSIEREVKGYKDSYAGGETIAVFVSAGYFYSPAKSLSTKFSSAFTQ